MKKEDSGRVNNNDCGESSKNRWMEKSLIPVAEIVLKAVVGSSRMAKRSKIIQI